MPNDKLLRIILDDLACPSFCSFTKLYFGTAEEIGEFAELYGEHRRARLDMEKQAYEKKLLDLYAEESAQRYTPAPEPQPDPGLPIDDNGYFDVGKLKNMPPKRPDIPRTEDGKIDYERLLMSYGRMAQKLARNLYRAEHDEESYDGAWREYLSGNKEAMVAAAMSSWKFVEDQVEVFASKSFRTGPGEGIAKNIYDYETPLAWDALECEVLWVSTFNEEGGDQFGNGRQRFPVYYRIIKTSFEGFRSFGSFSKKWNFPPYNRSIPGILDLVPEEEVSEPFTRADGKVIKRTYSPKGNISTRLWIIEKGFKEMPDMVADIEEHADKKTVDIDLSMFWQELVGDV